jgi:diguanylate cyclase (GGDEF)-like protein
MPEFPSTQFAEHGRGLFSPVEIERLMRAEFDRAQRHKYPIVCLLIAVDRLDQLQDLYGIESKDEILEGVVGVLRGATRDSDYLGFLRDDRIVALFPHTAPESGAMLAKRLLAGAKKLRFERDGRSLRVSLSIGVSHNRHEGTLSFDTLLQVAEDGLEVADSGGGDRFVETELYQLYERKRRGRGAEPAARPEAVLAPLPSPAGMPPLAPGPAEPTPAGRLGEAILDLLASQGHSLDSLASLDRDAIAQLIRSLADEKSAAPSEDLDEARRKVDVLERRIAKLTHLLGITEEELKRIAAMKGLDLGVASIYRTVQGLGDDAAQKEKKREMMKVIFEANFELKQQIGTQSPPRAS